jgi:hypothetical protein
VILLAVQLVKKGLNMLDADDAQINALEAWLKEFGETHAHAADEEPICGKWEARNPVRKLEVQLGFVRVAGEDEIEEGKAKVFTINGKALAIFRVNDEYFATSNRRLHRGGPLGGSSTGPRSPVLGMAGPTMSGLVPST